MTETPKAQASKGKDARFMTTILAGGAFALSLAALLVAVGPNADKTPDGPSAPAETAEKTDGPELTASDLAQAIRTDPDTVIQALTRGDSFKARLDTYLMDNPESMLDALDAYRQEQEAAANKPVSDDLRAAIENPDKGRLVTLSGDASDPVTIVKFHDDNCGYCRRAIETIDRLAESRDDVQIAVRPFPVLGEGSRAAAEVSIGLAEQDLYKGWYKTLPSDDVAQLNRDNAIALAKELGADIEKIEDAMTAGETNAELSENLELGRDAGVQGTPTFFVNGKRVRGAVPYEAMVQEVEDALARAEEKDAG